VGCPRVEIFLHKLGRVGLTFLKDELRWLLDVFRSVLCRTLPNGYLMPYEAYARYTGYHSTGCLYLERSVATLNYNVKLVCKVLLNEFLGYFVCVLTYSRLYWCYV
jgi:hypothetical protein